MNTKLCIKCKQEKPFDQFSKRYENPKNDYGGGDREVSYHTYCKSCVNAYAKEFRKTQKNYQGSGKVNQYPKEHRKLISLLRYRLRHCKQRQKGAVNLTIDYLYSLYKEQEGKCALSGVAFELEKHSLLVPSLDKIIPKKGYVKGNVQWLAWAVNRAKGEMSQAMFIDMCKKVIIKCNDYPEKEYTISD